VLYFSSLKMYGLLTKCEVTMAGYWPSSFFACLWTETESRSINLQNNERGQYQAILTEQAWSIKDLSYGFWGNFSRGTRRIVPSGQDSSILPACGASHIIKQGLIQNTWREGVGRECWELPVMA